MDERIKAILLYITTPHPLPHPKDWFRWIRKCLIEFFNKRDAINAQFEIVESGIGDLSITGLTALIDANTTAKQNSANSLSSSVSAINADISNNLTYWAQWQATNLGAPDGPGAN